nr:MAG TPA: hypothetical protein [Caudoviricetes sp.]
MSTPFSLIQHLGFYTYTHHLSRLNIYDERYFVHLYGFSIARYFVHVQ